MRTTSLRSRDDIVKLLDMPRTATGSASHPDAAESQENKALGEAVDASFAPGVGRRSQPGSKTPGVPRVGRQDKRQTPATRREVLRLAVDADVDPSAVDRLLSGHRVRAATRLLVTQAAERLGLQHLLPAADATSTGE